MSEAVARALRDGAPVVALESTIITHGLPRPENLAAAIEFEQTVAQGGAVPATIAMLDGVAHVGLARDQLERLALSDTAVKLSARDLPIAIAQRLTGGTTVAATRATRIARRDPHLCHRRDWRRTPRRPNHARRIGRPRDPWRLSHHCRIGGHQIDPGHRRHARAPGKPQRARGRVRNRPLPGFLVNRQRSSG